MQMFLKKKLQFTYFFVLFFAYVKKNAYLCTLFCVRDKSL